MKDHTSFQFEPSEMLCMVEGEPGNYYGCVAVWIYDGKWWMGVENWNGWNGCQISERLYKAFAAEFKE